MGRTRAPTGFAWLEPHDAARRDASVLFGVALGVLILYGVGVFALVVLVAEAAVGGTADRLASFDVATVAAVGGIGLGCVAVVALSTLLAWREARNRRARDVGARRPTADEAAQVDRLLATAAEPYGAEIPRLAVHDAAAPNGAAWASSAGGTVCLTTGALRLPADELGALCRQLVTGLEFSARDRAADAVDLILIAERWTQFVWLIGAVAFLFAAATTSSAVAGAVLLGVVILIVITRPAVLLATHALPRLFARIDELVDLESTRRSADPEPLARLLVHLLEDNQQVATSWRVVQLWFEREATEPTTSDCDPSSSAALLHAGIPSTGKPLQRVWARAASTTLASRARIAVNLADGDRQLRTRLQRAISS